MPLDFLSAFLSAGGVLSAADALTRDWIDWPAVVRRHQLNPEPTPPAPLSPDRLRDLLERRHTLTGRIGSLDVDIAHLPRRLTAAVAARDAQRRCLVDAERRLANAREKLAALDRPWRRRKHGGEIILLGEQIEREPRYIAEHHTNIADLDADITRLAKRAAGLDPLRAERTVAQHELDEIRAELSIDAIGRVETARRAPSVIASIGPRPPGPQTTAWDQTAGLIAQHHSAYGRWPNLANRRGIGRDTAEVANLDHIHHTIAAQSGQIGRTLQRDSPALSR